MKSTILTYALILLVAGLLTACGDKKSNTADTYKIGIVVPLSGNGTTIGTHSSQGVQLAVAEINAQGGLLGKQIELEIQDSKSDPKEGVSIIKNMMSESHKPFMVYSIISGVTMAMRPETEANHVILMGAVGTSKFIPQAKYTIRNYVSADAIGKMIAPFIRDSLKLPGLSIFYANNEYSTSVKDGVEQKCKALGLSVQFTQSFDEKTPDYKSLVATSINKQTQCIFIDGIGNGMGTMIKQIRESGYTGAIVSDPIIKFPDVMTAAGNAIKGVYYMDYSYDESLDNPKTKAFVDSFQAKFHSFPANFAAIGYEGMKMLLMKINEIGTLDSDRIIESINTIKDHNGVLGPVSVLNREMQFTYTYKRF